MTWTGEIIRNFKKTQRSVTCQIFPCQSGYHFVLAPYRPWLLSVVLRFLSQWRVVAAWLGPSLVTSRLGKKAPFALASEGQQSWCVTPTTPATPHLILSRPSQCMLGFLLKTHTRTHTHTHPSLFWIPSYRLILCSFFVVFGPLPRHVEVPSPRMEPAPQQPSEPQQ